MPPNAFHLAFFTNFVVDEWNEPFSSADGKPTLRQTLREF